MLVPRPETELLVESAIELATVFSPPSCLIADIGTGCGAIAVALAVSLPKAKVYATDISNRALEIAASNCQRHSVGNRITLLQGNLVEPLPEPVHLIVANLPYVKESELAELSPEISTYEPRIALAGGIDGLRVIEEFILQSGAKLQPQGAILLEIGHDQGQAVCEMARRHFPQSTVSMTTDLSGLDRVVSIILGR